MATGRQVNFPRPRCEEQASGAETTTGGKAEGSKSEHFEQTQISSFLYAKKNCFRRQRLWPTVILSICHSSTNSSYLSPCVILHVSLGPRHPPIEGANLKYALIGYMSPGRALVSRARTPRLVPCPHLPSNAASSPLFVTPPNSGPLLLLEMCPQTNTSFVRQTAPSSCAQSTVAMSRCVCGRSDAGRLQVWSRLQPIHVLTARNTPEFSVGISTLTLSAYSMR